MASGSGSGVPATISAGATTGPQTPTQTLVGQEGGAQVGPSAGPSIGGNSRNEGASLPPGPVQVPGPGGTMITAVPATIPGNPVNATSSPPTVDGARASDPARTPPSAPRAPLDAYMAGTGGRPPTPSPSGASPRGGTFSPGPQGMSGGMPQHPPPLPPGLPPGMQGGGRGMGPGGPSSNTGGGRQGYPLMPPYPYGGYGPQQGPPFFQGQPPVFAMAMPGVPQAPPPPAGVPQQAPAQAPGVAAGPAAAPQALPPGQAPQHGGPGGAGGAGGAPYRYKYRNPT